MVMKVHRLGRTSFRSIKNNRDYMQGRKAASWLYMARLAALREYAYMKALHENDFPVPTPIDHNRHCIIMSRVYARPFAHAARLLHTGTCYSTLMNLIIRLAEHGLIHCDFNEFNLMIDKEENITMIDFPQMVSTTHENSNMYFDRDVQCVRTYFKKRFKFDSMDFPRLEADTTRTATLDVTLRASGCDKKELAAFEAFINDVNDGLVKQVEDEGEEDSGSEQGDEVEGEVEEEEDEVVAGTAASLVSVEVMEEVEVVEVVEIRASAGKASSSAVLTRFEECAGAVVAAEEESESDEEEGDEGDESEEEEEEETPSERRARKKALPPKRKTEEEKAAKLKKKEKSEEAKSAKVKQHAKSAVDRRNREQGPAAGGTDAKRNTQKIFRNKEKKMIKAQMDSVGHTYKRTAQ
jgi:RIO kinase 2